MKRMLSIFLSLNMAVMMAVSLSACNEEALSIQYTDTYIENQDYQYMFTDGFGHSTFQKSDKGYYCRVGEFLYFIDKDNLNAAPLCNKPNCLHDKETDEKQRAQCDAYLPLASNSMTNYSVQYYNKKLYVIVEELSESGDNSTKFILTEISPENGRRKEIYTYSDGQIYFWALHRGSLYFYADNYLITDTNEPNKNDSHFSQVIRVNLSNLEETTLYNMENTKNVYGLLTTGNVWIYGNHLYIGYMGYNNEDSHKKSFDKDSDSSGLYDDIITGYIHIDLVNETINPLFENSASENKVISSFMNDKMLLKGERLYSCNLDGGEISEYPVSDGSGYVFYDGKNILESYYNEDAPNQIAVLNDNFEKVRTYFLPKNYDPLIGVQLLTPYDENYLFGFANNNDSWQMVYIDKGQLELDNQEELNYRILYELG